MKTEASHWSAFLCVVSWRSDHSKTILERPKSHREDQSGINVDDSAQNMPAGFLTFSSRVATLKTSSATDPTARRAALEEWTSFQMVSLST